MTNNKKKYIPKLRFPEFQNNGEWNNVLIGDIIKIVTPQKKVPTLEYRKIGLFPIIDQSLKHIAGYSDDKTALLNIHKCDYIIFGDHTCSIKLINFPFIQGADGIKIFYSNNQCLHTHFLYQYLLAYPIHPNGYKRHFSELKEQTIFYPTNIQEQKKIASCLSSLDTYIDTTKRKLELLKEYKKGLMQQLFPTPGKNIPELRFPEFREASAWVHQTLGSMGDTYGGLSGKSAEDFGKGKPYVTYKQVFTSIEIDFSNCSLVQIAQNEKQNKLQYGDILVTISSETPEEIGYTALVTTKKIPECYLNSFCFIFRLFDKRKIDINFMIYLLSSDVYRKNVVRIAQGITRFNISKTRYKEIELPIPSSKGEQRKIAKLLSSIDQQLTHYEEKIRSLELHKKGLTQRLFPKI